MSQNREFNAFVEAAFSANLFIAIFPGLRDHLSDGLGHRCERLKEACYLTATSYLESGKNPQQHENELSGLAKHLNRTRVRCDFHLGNTAVYFRYVCVVTAIICLLVLLFDLQNKAKPWATVLILPFLGFIVAAYGIYLWNRLEIWWRCYKFKRLQKDRADFNNPPPIPPSQMLSNFKKRP